MAIGDGSHVSALVRSSDTSPDSSPATVALWDI